MTPGTTPELGNQRLRVPGEAGKGDWTFWDGALCCTLQEGPWAQTGQIWGGKWGGKGVPPACSGQLGLLEELAPSVTAGCPNPKLTIKHALQRTHVLYTPVPWPGAQGQGHRARGRRLGCGGGGHVAAARTDGRTDGQSWPLWWEWPSSLQGPLSPGLGRPLTTLLAQGEEDPSPGRAVPGALLPAPLQRAPRELPGTWPRAGAAEVAQGPGRLRMWALGEGWGELSAVSFLGLWSGFKFIHRQKKRNCIFYRCFFLFSCL